MENQDTDEDVVIAPNANDEIINPMKQYVGAYVQKEFFLIALVPLVIDRWASIYAFNGSKSAVRGLIEYSLPSPMDEHIEIYRKYLKRQMSTVPQEDKEKLSLARAEFPKINKMVLKMIVEIARNSYGDDIPSFASPKKATPISGGSVSGSTEKSVKSVEKNVIAEERKEEDDADGEDLDDTKEADDLDLNEDNVSAMTKSTTHIPKNVSREERVALNKCRDSSYIKMDAVLLIETIYKDIHPDNFSKIIVYDPCRGKDSVLNAFCERGFSVIGDDIYYSIVVPKLVMLNLKTTKRIF